MKKTKIEKIAGGTKTTVTGSNGETIITYDGVSNLQIGRTFTYEVPSSASAGSRCNHNKETTTSSNYTVFSSKLKTGLTFKKVDRLQLNSKEINKIFSSEDHKTYENSNDYRSPPPASSKNYQP